MGSPQLARGFLEYSTNRFLDGDQPECFDTLTLQGVYDIRAEVGRVTCKLLVKPCLQNRNGTLHGGCIATTVDIVGTAALLTKHPKGGVSLNINTNYLAPMPGGGVVLIDAKVLRVGRTIAVINVDLQDDASGKLVAQGTHVKYISENEPDLLRLAGDMDAAPLTPPAPPPGSNL